MRLEVLEVSYPVARGFTLLLHGSNSTNSLTKLISLSHSDLVREKIGRIKHFPRIQKASFNLPRTVRTDDAKRETHVIKVHVSPLCWYLAGFPGACFFVLISIYIIWKPITSFLTKKQEENNHFPLGSTLTTLPPCRIAPTWSHLPVIDPVSRNQPGCSKLH